MGRPTTPPEIRFWRKVDKTPGHGPWGRCWLWTGSLRKGYGDFGSIGKEYRRIPAHRFSWLLRCRRIPDGLQVCHACDTPACVNPAHLFLGNHKSNTADMIAKGRKACVKGERNGWSKLTAEQVVEIRASYGPGVTLKILARKYGVTFGTISAIVHRKLWPHVA